MHVLHIISSTDPRGGGPAAALVGMAVAQRDAGLAVTVCSTWAAGEDLSVADRFRECGINVELIGPCAGPLRRHPQMKEIIRRLIINADLVHIHALWEEIQHRAAQVAQQLNKPYIITPHGMLTPWSLAQKSLKKKLYMALRLNKNLRRASAIHYTTQTERQMSASVAGATPAIVESLGVDLSEFDQLPPKGAFRTKYPSIGDRPLIVFLGRIHPGKGLEYLVPAIAQLANTETMLAIVGPDSQGYRAEIEKRVAQNNLRDRIVFTGLLRGPDRVAALRDADLFCLPSDHENFGVAIVEALAAGTPVVISDQVNIKDEIRTAGVGGVVPTDADALAKEIDQWLANPARREHAASRCRAFVADNYDWNTIARHWAEHYSRLA